MSDFVPLPFQQRGSTAVLHSTPFSCRLICRRRNGFFLLVSLLVSLAGCGNQGAPTYPASGSVRINGEIPEGAQIVFHPQNQVDFDSQGARPTGKVKADGSYELTTYEIGDGAPEGVYRVTIYWAENPDAFEPSPDRFGGKLLSPENSPIERVIQRKSNEIDPIEFVIPE